MELPADSFHEMSVLYQNALGSPIGKIAVEDSRELTRLGEGREVAQRLFCHFEGMARDHVWAWHANTTTAPTTQQTAWRRRGMKAMLMTSYYQLLSLLAAARFSDIESAAHPSLIRSMLKSTEVYVLH